MREYLPEGKVHAKKREKCGNLLFIFVVVFSRNNCGLRWKNPDTVQSIFKKYTHLISRVFECFMFPMYQEFPCREIVEVGKGYAIFLCKYIVSFTRIFTVFHVSLQYNLQLKILEWIGIGMLEGKCYCFNCPFTRFVLHFHLQILLFLFVQVCSVSICLFVDTHEISSRDRDTYILKYMDISCMVGK